MHESRWRRGGLDRLAPYGRYGIHSMDQRKYRKKLGGVDRSGDEGLEKD